MNLKLKNISYLVGGTRKVVLLLPDGNLMMTDVTAEQYAALEMDN